MKNGLFRCVRNDGGRKWIASPSAYNDVGEKKLSYNDVGEKKLVIFWFL